MAKDKEIEIEILEDGTVRSTTGGFSGASHKKADDFMKYLQSLIGGEVESEPVPEKRQTTHEDARRKARQ